MIDTLQHVIHMSAHIALGFTLGWMTAAQIPIRPSRR